MSVRRRQWGPYERPYLKERRSMPLERRDLPLPEEMTAPIRFVDEVCPINILFSTKTAVGALKDLQAFSLA